MDLKLPLQSRIYLLLFVAAFTFGSCSSTKKASFNTSTYTPEAEGHVKVKKDKNANYLIEVNVENLADSKKLTPSKNTYVAWIETEDKGAKNIGQIHSSEAMFSKARKASITTVSPIRPIRIFITAEDDGNVEIPSDMVILTTNPF
jgi:hypothetical protein